MPGFIAHMVTGSVMVLVGRYYFRTYFNTQYKLKRQLLLIVICLLGSFLPDLFLAFYYTTHILTFNVFIWYHRITHLIICPIAIIVLFWLVLLDTNRKPIWAMGLWSLILHLTLDYFFP